VNVFAVDRDPVRAARALCDRHVVKMTLETAQILCTAARTRLGRHAPYRATHASHPCVAWAAARRENWAWLVRHGLALADEYERRFGRVHASRAVIERMAPLAPAPCGGRRQPFAQVMPERYRGPDAVVAYRRYYAAEKGRFATWRAPARAPRWWRTLPERAPDRPHPRRRSRTSVQNAVGKRRATARQPSAA
jgi:hypothetical protein